MNVMTKMESQLDFVFALFIPEYIINLFSCHKIFLNHYFSTFLVFYQLDEFTALSANPLLLTV